MFHVKHRDKKVNRLKSEEYAATLRGLEFYLQIF